MLSYKHLLSLLLFSSATAFCEQVRPISKAPQGRVNFPSNFQVEEGCDLFLFGDYLYWVAKEDGLYFAQTGFQNPPPGGDVTFKGKLKKIQPTWSSGARMGAGLSFPKNGYEIALDWTWFATNIHTSSNPSSDLLLPLWSEPDFNPFAGALKAKALWNLNLNVFDLTWGRSSWFGEHLSIKPFFGLRATWLEQNLKTHYIYDTSPTTFEHLRARSNFCGGGMRAGIDARFYFPFDFNIYGKASGSLLYGKSNAHLNTTEDTLTIARTKDHFTKGISSAELGLGLSWDHHIAKERLHIEFHIGWESNLWFGINQMNHFLNQLHTGSFFKEHSNLSTQGLVAGGRFDF